MRVVRSGVNFQLTAHQTAEIVLRQHALHRELDNALRMGRDHLFKRNELLATHVAGVTEVLLLFFLVAGQTNLVGIDHDDEIAGIDVRREQRLALAAQDGGDFTGQPAEDFALRIDHPPLTLYVFRLWYVCLHSLVCICIFGLGTALKSIKNKDFGQLRMKREWATGRARSGFLVRGSCSGWGPKKSGTLNEGFRRVTQSRARALVRKPGPGPGP